MRETFGISRAELSPRVRSYDANLDTQARLLFDKYHLAHYDQDAILKAIENRTVSLEDAHHLRDLLAQRDHIRLTGELPPQARENLEFQLHEAQEVLGAENVYGPDHLKAVFGVELESKDIPPITFSREDLEKARKLGMRLVLRVSNDADGVPLTPMHMQELVRERLIGAGNSRFLFENGGPWCKNESFFNETPTTRAAEWKLVSSTILHESTSKDYSEQLIFIRDTLKELGWLTTEEEIETNNALGEIAIVLEKRFADEGLKEAGKRIADLLMVKNHRRTISQALYDAYLDYFAEPDPSRGKFAFFSASEDVTRSLSSDSYFVHLDSSGPRLVVAKYPLAVLDPMRGFYITR